MNQAQIERLEKSFNLLAPRAQELSDRFYAKLFVQHPEVRPMFPRDMSGQKQKLIASLSLVVKNLQKPENLREPLLEMGKRHVDYGTLPEQYPVVRGVLVSVMADMAGEAWNTQLDVDWKVAIDFVSSIMIEGARSVVAEPATA
jgi:hemoglobin-like flavoprotein